MLSLILNSPPVVGMFNTACRATSRSQGFLNDGSHLASPKPSDHLLTDSFRKEHVVSGHNSPYQPSRFL